MTIAHLSRRFKSRLLFENILLREVVVYTSLILFITLFIFAALLTIKCRFHNTFSLKECMQILWNVTKYFVVGKFYHLITIIIHRDNIDSFQIYICWEWYLDNRMRTKMNHTTTLPISQKCFNKHRLGNTTSISFSI